MTYIHYSTSFHVGEVDSVFCLFVCLVLKKEKEKEKEKKEKQNKPHSI